jgi:hypothetical protein
MSDEREQQALRMIETLRSVGVPAFNLTRIDINRQVAPEGYRPGRSIEAMRLLLPAWIRLAWEFEQSLIVRAHKPTGGIIAQLDDLKTGQIDRVREKAFLTVETSRGNFQVWLAIEGGDEAFVKRLMKGIGSDPRANCSGRVAGSPNVKLKYAPDFPTVRIVGLQPGRTVTPAELESLGLIAASAAARALVPAHFRGSDGGRGWPDYERCLRGAPATSKGLPDRSKADYLWCKWAIERGQSTDAVHRRLIEVSEKARHESRHGNRNYAQRTVDAAAKAAVRSVIPFDSATRKVVF